MRPATLFLFSGSLIAALAPSASALPTFFATHGSDLYRIHGSDVDVFDLGEVKVGAAATDAFGTIWLSGTDLNDSDRHLLMTLDDPMGSPSPVVVGDFLVESTPSLSWINGTLYGAQQFVFPGPQNLVTIDPVLETQQLVGATGTMGTLSPSTAFDPASQTLYGVRKDGTSVLHQIDWDLTDGPDPTATIVGPTNVETQSTGGEWHNGTYFHAIVTPDGNGTYSYVLGRIDVATGNFTPLRTFATELERGSSGLAILPVPEPASLVLMCAGGAIGARRRRSH